LVNILHNISRHVDGINALNSLQAADLMKQIQNNDSFNDKDDFEKIILIRMTLALRITPEQIENDRKRLYDTIDHLLQCVYAAGQSEDHCHDGLHICGSLIFLVILISCERTVDYFLEHTEANFGDMTQSAIQFLIESCLKFNRNEDPLKCLTMTAFCNIFWSISLRHQCKQELQKNEEFKKLIKEIAEKKEKIEPLQNVPKCIESMQKAAEGILFNIKGPLIRGLRALFLVARSSSIDINSRSSRSKFEGPNLMISYAQGDNNICTQLYNELAKRNIAIDICIDWKYCNIDFPWEKTYNDMSNPNVVLCLLSEKYYESSFCQREFITLLYMTNVIYVCIDRTEIPGWLSKGLF
jgi:hypothetical protein